MQKTLSLTAVALALSLAWGGAQAASVTFKGTLSGASEVPPTTSAGKGNVTAMLDTTTKMLTWTVDYSGLTGPAMAAHFHCPAPAGKNAGVAVPLTGSLDSPIKGSATLTDAQIADFQAGNCYFNIHTTANKPGEVRAQMMK